MAGFAWSRSAEQAVAPWPAPDDLHRGHGRPRSGHRRAAGGHGPQPAGTANRPGLVQVVDGFAAVPLTDLPREYRDSPLAGFRYNFSRN